MHTLTWNYVNLLFMAFALIVSHIHTQINPSKIWNHEWLIPELSTAREKKSHANVEMLWHCLSFSAYNVCNNRQSGNWVHLPLLNRLSHQKLFEPMSELIDTLNFDGISAAKQKENSHQFSNMWQYLDGFWIRKNNTMQLNEFKWKIH